MTYFAHIIQMITVTGGFYGDVVKVEAATGAEAVQHITATLKVATQQVYLISEQESQGWSELGISIQEIV